MIYISLETVWNEKELRSLKILGILCLERFVRPSLYGILNHRSINISIFSKVLSLFLIARAIVGANAKGNFMVFRYLTSVSHTGSCNDPCKSSLCKLLKKPPLPCLLSSLDIYIYIHVGWLWSWPTNSACIAMAIKNEQKNRSIVQPISRFSLPESETLDSAFRWKRRELAIRRQAKIGGLVYIRRVDRRNFIIG